MHEKLDLATSWGLAITATILSVTDAEHTLRIAAYVLTIGYTLHRWIDYGRNKRKNRDDS